MNRSTIIANAEFIEPLSIAKDYSHYLQLVKQINAARRVYNQESDAWVRQFNDRKTHENLIKLMLQVPEKFTKIHQAFSQISPVLNQYCVAEHWFKTQPYLLQNEMNHWYGWSARARLARKKYELLLFPTAEVGRYVRYADPEFYQTYLNYCQCPSVTLNDWQFHLKYLAVIAEEEFTEKKVRILCS